MDTQQKKRDCGDCIVCCVYLRISSLEKPGMVQCKHLMGVPEQTENMAHYTGCETGSCSIYPERPKVCREYSCLWRYGAGKEEDRPDRSLLLVDTLHQIENVIEVKPLAPGREDEPEAREVVLRLCQETGKVGLVSNFYERRLVRAVGVPPEVPRRTGWVVESREGPAWDRVSGDVDPWIADALPEPLVEAQLRLANARVLFPDYEHRLREEI